MTWQVINGSSAEILKTYPDNSFDAVVTDPPYGINFLGKAWDSNTGDREVYEQCLRVLKPGGHLLAFSAARTYHHLAMTVETVGFEIRDQIMWIYGSGFPKSQDVGKAMDRRAGKADSKTSLLQAKEILKTLYSNSGKTTTQINSECGFNATGYLATEGKHKGWAQNLPLNEKWQKIKEVVGCDDTYDYLFTSVEREIVGTKQSGCFSDEERHTIGASETQTVDITIPKSNSARQWDGWGTQLKPAHEPIVMARKPIKNTVMDNVQEYGTGAINIDACRVGSEIFDTSQNRRNTQNGQIYDGGWAGKEGGELVQGRFPANVIMDDEAGKILDEQAPKVGNLFSGKRTKSSTTGSGHSLVKAKHEGEDNGVFDGLGGASRFFYCPKVSGKERNIGCEDIKDQQHLAADGTPLKGHGLNRVCATCNAPQLKPELCLCKEKSWISPQKTGNNHPTVKPIELMKYLIKLVTPPNGHILDPFNGSGSTGCAAVELGFDYTGIELDPNYVEIANKRISHWEQECKPKTTYNNLFEEY